MVEAGIIYLVYRDYCSSKLLIYFHHRSIFVLCIFICPCISDLFAIANFLVVTVGENRCTTDAWCLLQAATDVDVHAVCQAILAYSGWCVPLRDIQRLRLRGLPSAVIRTAMETLEQTGVGRCCEVTGNMCVFYKCPPHLITAESLTRWQLTWNDYSVQFMSLPSLNQTNRHNESYWQRVASSSPYSCV